MEDNTQCWVETVVATSLPYVLLRTVITVNVMVAVLSCSGSIDGNNQLIIKGRFQQKQIESVLRRYISESEIKLLYAYCCSSGCFAHSLKSTFLIFLNTGNTV